MRDLELVDAAALKQQLARATTSSAAPLPIDELAAVAAAAWHDNLSGPGTAAQRQDRAIVTVVRDTYRLGLAAGRPPGAAAVLAHLGQAVQAIAGQLQPGDAVHIVDQMQRQLRVVATHYTRPVDPTTLPELPLPRTYLAAFRDGAGHVTLDRVADAAVVGWTHGVEDGWGEGYLIAERIIAPVRDSHLAATTTVAARPTRAWLDNLTASAYRVAAKPAPHPAHLARLAAAEPGATPGDQPVPSPAPPGTGRHNDIRGHRR